MAEDHMMTDKQEIELVRHLSSFRGSIAKKPTCHSSRQRYTRQLDLEDVHELALVLPQSLPTKLTSQRLLQAFVKLPDPSSYNV